MTINELDKKAIEVSKKYKRYENLLLEVIIELDQQKAFYKLGFNSLFAYVTERLKLSPAVTYNFINVARKSIEVPELKKEVLAGNISISKAQKMTSVLNKDNHSHWLKLAKTQTHRKLEREVALVSPNTAIKEQIKYVNSQKEVIEKVKFLTSLPRIQLQIGVSEKKMMKLRRAQDLECQKNKKNVNIEKTLDAVLEAYLSKYDPVRKAQRQKIKGQLNINSNTQKIKQNLNKGNDPQEMNERAELQKITRVKKFAKTNSSQRRVQNSLLPVNNFGKKNRRLAVPANIFHQIQLRYQGQCSYIDINGKRCYSKRFLEVHHLKPVSEGGNNELNNLQLLCSGHHKVCHQML